VVTASLFSLDFITLSLYRHEDGSYSSTGIDHLVFSGALAVAAGVLSGALAGVLPPPSI
jgi:hypothetical protein